VTESSGSYKVNDYGKIRTITYVQSAALDRKTGKLNWSLIKQQTKSFFMDFEGYIRQQENREGNDP